MDLLNLAKSLISFRTEAPPGDEDGCARFIRDSLQDLHMEGAEFELHTFQTGRSNLVAKLGGGLAPGLLLAGHMDVVPVKDASAWSSPPFEAQVRDGRLYGRGAADMKSALAAMMAAIASVKGERLKRGIVFVATAGEEIGYDGLHALIRAEKDSGAPIKAAYGIVGEPTELRVVRAHRGGLTCRVTFEGRSAHASNPALGVNSIESCVAFVQRLDGLRGELGLVSDEDLGTSIVTPTEIRGGTKSNVIPESCELTLDCRLIPAHTPETIVAGLNRIVDDLGAKDKTFRAKVEAVYAGYALSLPEASEVVMLGESLTGAPSVVAPYGTEAPLYGQLGIPTVVLGPGSIRQAHIRDEYVEMGELEAAHQVYERFIRRVCL